MFIFCFSRAIPIVSLFSRLIWLECKGISRTNVECTGVFFLVTLHYLNYDQNSNTRIPRAWAQKSREKKQDYTAIGIDKNHMETIECALHTCFVELNPCCTKIPLLYTVLSSNVVCTIRMYCVDTLNRKKRQQTHCSIWLWLTNHACESKRTHIEATPFLSLSHIWRFCQRTKCDTALCYNVNICKVDELLFSFTRSLFSCSFHSSVV